MTEFRIEDPDGNRPWTGQGKGVQVTPDNSKFKPTALTVRGGPGSAQLDVLLANTVLVAVLGASVLLWLRNALFRT